MGFYAGFGLGVLCGAMFAIGSIIIISVLQADRMAEKEAELLRAVAPSDDLVSFREFMISADAGELGLL